jgi:hypothetical protein
MSRTSIAAAAALVALALPTAAAAETSVFAEAKKGQLRVLSSVLLTRKAVDMRGGWLHDGQSCTTERRLRVVVDVVRTRGGSTSGFSRLRTAKRMNCAEGGPNLGFHLDAADTGFACPNGTWRPGRYEFVTKTKHLASGVVSVASLGWTKQAAC